MEERSVGSLLRWSSGKGAIAVVLDSIEQLTLRPDFGPFDGGVFMDGEF
jgi:hypothetical protein